MRIDRLPAAQPIVAPSGRPTTFLLGWVSDLAAVVNDLVDRTADGVPADRTVTGSGGLRGGGALSGDVGLSLYRAVAPVAQLPTTGNAAGDWAFAVDGRKPGEAAGAGSGTPVFWSHTAWFSVSGVQVQS